MSLRLQPLKETTLDKFTRFFEFIVKSGPWALVVIIMLAWLAGDYGYLQSQSRLAAEIGQKHSDKVDLVVVQQRILLERIVDVLEQQRLIQAQTGLLTCLKETRNDLERTNCVKQFPLTKPTNGGSR